MEVSVLGSGSKGNSIFIKNNNFSFIIDAGFTGRELDRRLSEIGHQIKDIRAILITHDHGDHINGAGVVSRNTGSKVYANYKMYYKLKRRLGKKIEYSFIEPEVSFTLDTMQVTPFETPHDAIQANGFIIESNGLKIGVATDVGHPSSRVIDSLRGCDMLVLESNHDSKMLATGPYPQVLKDRVNGDEGHLSNSQTAEILKEVAHEGLKRVIFVHLSEENNKERLVIESAQKALEGYNTEIVISSQYGPTELFKV